MSQHTMRRCPACDHEVMSTEWLCPACSFVVDAAFLGNEITNEPPPSPRPPVGDEPAITFVVGGPRPPAPAFRRRRAHAPTTTTFVGGLPATLVQQHMRFSVEERHLEGPLKLFLMETWSVFIRGRPALLALPSLVNTNLPDKPPRTEKALETQTLGLLATRRGFHVHGFPGALVKTGDGRIGFAQPLSPGIRLRELWRATKAEGNMLAEEVAIAAVLAVAHGFRGYSGANPVGAPVDVFVCFDGTVGVARFVNAMCIDSGFNQYTSEQLAPRTAQSLRSLLGDARPSDALASVLELEGPAFIEGLESIVAVDPQRRRDVIAAAARGVFPDRYAASVQAASACEDQLLEPLVFPPIEALNVPEGPLRGGGVITTDAFPITLKGDAFRQFLLRVERRVATTAELQAAIDDGVVVGASGLCQVADDHQGTVLAEIVNNRVRTPSTPRPGSPTDRAFLVGLTVPWPDP